MAHFLLMVRANEQSARNGLRAHGLWVSLLLLSLGLQFCRPANTFLSAEIYREMAKVMSEDTWGAIMITLGSCRIASLLASFLWGDKPATTTASCVLSGLSTALWWKVSILFYIVNPIGWSCLAAFTFALHDATSCVYLARIAGNTQKKIVVNGPRITV